MQTRRSAFARLVATATLVTAVTFGAHAFVPAAYGCGSQTGNGSCREAQTAPGLLDLYKQISVLKGAIVALLP